MNRQTVKAWWWCAPPVLLVVATTLVFVATALRSSEAAGVGPDIALGTPSGNQVPVNAVTWARRDGWPENGMASYARMQSAIDDGYLTIAREQHVAVAPVGFAWSRAVDQDARSGLWQDDGSHPAAKGTYLAACVFYASIFRQSPLGLTYYAGLTGDEEAQMQRIAADTVLGDVARWGLRSPE
jgi:hypothetical protein